MGYGYNWQVRAGSGPSTGGDSRNGVIIGQGRYQAPQRHQTLAGPTRRQTFAHAPVPSQSCDLRRRAIQGFASKKPGLKSIAETQDSLPDGSSVNSVRQYSNRAEILEKHEFKPGLIFNAVLHQEDSQPNKMLSAAKSKARSMSAYGPVFSVPRYMIVVGLKETTYISVALYTHEHTGLVGKEHYLNEFVSVRDGRIPAADFTALSKYKPVVTTGKGHVMDKQSVAYFGNPVTKRYECPITRCGFLTEESAVHLATLFQKEMNAALKLS